ncbi:choice-of-anchor A family protein, partial [Ruminococcus sp.]|uniref:choice-of-anchor A family protein n=1 Tax=Ruminococcus sp. TaxID=41978 RepID=UPI0025D77566
MRMIWEIIFRKPRALNGKKVTRSQVYATELFDFEEQFALLKERSKKMSKMKTKTTVTIENGKAIFDDSAYAGQKKESVVFNCTAEEWSKIQNCGAFKFTNIPELPESRKVITWEKNYVDWDYAYIIINVDGTAVTVANDNVRTSINGIKISTDDGAYNNHYGVSSLLYNFYNATSLKLGKNFQGTVFAPNANVTDGDNGRGHLSGALIAKSFEGSTEFGYRPYDILGASTSYTIDLNKVDAASKSLAGAEISMYEKNPESGEWELMSTRLTRDSAIQFTIGDETPDKATTLQEYYYIEETKAPDGYTKSPQRYYIDYEEKYESLKVENGDSTFVPKEVNITMYPVSMDGTKPDSGKTYTVTMGYDVTGNEITEKTFTYRVDKENDYKKYTLTKEGKAWKYEGKAIGTAARFDDTTIPGMRIDTKNMTIYPQLLAPGAGEPANQDAIPKIDNTQVFTIKKVDESGTLLPGATLELTEVVKDGTETAIKAFQGKEASQSLLLGTDIQVATDRVTYYVLREKEAPKGYEVAEPIYFYVTKAENNLYTLYYTEAAEDGKPDWTKAVESKNTVLSMVDVKITGAKVTLQKIDSESKDIITDAELSLYRADDTKVCDWDGETKVSGFLEPGVYYIVEKTAPKGYKKDLEGQKMYFTVNEDFSVQSGMPEYVSVKNPSNNQVDEFGAAYANAKITKIEVDVSSINGDSHAIQFKSVGDSTDFTENLMAGTNTFMPSDYSFGENGRMKITFWNANINEIRYYTESDSENVSHLEITDGDTVTIAVPNEVDDTITTEDTTTSTTTEDTATSTTTEDTTTTTTTKATTTTEVNT